MTKQNKTPLGIFAESIGLYFSNFDKFVQYMSFPVLGQIAGLGLVLLITFFYTQNLPNLIEKYPALNNFNALILLSIIITLPGLAIFIKAFCMVSDNLSTTPHSLHKLPKVKAPTNGQADGNKIIHINRTIKGNTIFSLLETGLNCSI